jgi:hypothetical protein
VRNAYKILIGKSEGKIALRRPKRRWEDNIKMDLTRIRVAVCGLDSVVQDRDQWRAFVNTVMNLQVP